MNKGRILIGQVLALSLIIFVFGNIVIVAQTYEFKNGKWFNGKEFEKKTLYSIDGVFSNKKPKEIDKTFDLKNGFVIPPFGDAHTHNLSDAKTFESQIENNLRDGNFYVQVLTNSQKSVAAIRQEVEKSPLDVLYANGGLTSTLGHPFFAFEPRAMGVKGRYWESGEKLAEIRKSRLAENDGYWFFDSKKDVDEKWDKYLAGKPDIVKIYLLDAKNQKNLSVEEKAGFKGLAPEVAEYVVKKAHESNLRVFAHIETADDLRLGTKIGVDGFAHLPGYSMNWNDSPEAAVKYDPTAEDFKKIAEKKIVVIPTLSLSKGYSYKWKSDGTRELNVERANKVATRQKKLLRLMLENDVPIAFGSDETDGTIIKEFLYVKEYNLLENLTLLQIAFETPHLMYPNRKVGKLKKGFEASFLVLDENPLENLEAIKNIKMRFKQGKFLEVNAKQNR